MSVIPMISAEPEHVCDGGIGVDVVHASGDRLDEDAGHVGEDACREPVPDRRADRSVAIDAEHDAARRGPPDGHLHLGLEQ
jgi:hypothetical protein